MTSFNIVDLITKNPITKLTETHNNNLLKYLTRNISIPSSKILLVNKKFTAENLIFVQVSYK